MTAPSAIAPQPNQTNGVDNAAEVIDDVIGAFEEGLRDFGRDSI